ncbi:MAG: hypothetical protein U0610_03535 [bacterium]
MEPRTRTLYRWIAGLALVVVTLAAACGVLASRLARARAALAEGDEASARQQVVRELAAQSPGIYDTFADPDVGRVLIPNLDKTLADGTRLVTNSYGMRERAYALPKPSGVVRVVLLGDSYVYGDGVNAEDRICAFLEPWLRQRSRASVAVECLQIGVSSWNIRAEASYLRRQLALLAPDLVVHVVVPNDLADSVSARGFGALAGFSSQRWDVAGSLVAGNRARRLGLAPEAERHLIKGFDYESRHRYDEAASAIQRLRVDLDRTSGRYALLVHWFQFTSLAREQLVTRLPGVEHAYLPASFARAADRVVSERNIHWNRHGNEEIARFLYGWIVAKGMLPGLTLGDWPEAAELYRRVAAEGEALAAEAPAPAPELLSRLDFAEGSSDRARAFEQIHGGIDAAGLVSPYASVLLARAGGTSLAVEGTALERPELAEVEVEVFVDDARLGSLRVEPGRPMRLAGPLPATVRDRDRFSVRFVARDWGYAGPELRDCVVFRLARVAVEP